MNLTYQIKTASAEEILIHLKSCNKDFDPPLEKKVDLRDYAEKLAERSVSFEAWNGNELVGLVAAYLNDVENKIGYITSVSVLKKYYGKGIANELMKNCINYAMQQNFEEIQLEVSQNSQGAIQLYKKFNFYQVGQEDQMVKMKLDLEKNN